MRLAKFFFIMVIITVVSVAYVQQQTSLLLLSYQIENKEKTIAELLDKNKILMYNVLSLESPLNLEKKLELNNVRLEMPGEWQVVNLPEVEAEAQEKLVSGKAKVKNVLLGIFNLKSQSEAEAKAETINSRELSRIIH